MAKTIKLAYSLFLLMIGMLVLASIVMLYPWDAMHGGVASVGPLHCEADRVSGSLLAGFKVSNLKVKWADLWELGVRELNVRIQPSGFLTGRLSVTGMMNGYTWRARNRQGTVPDISPELRRRLGRLALKLRCTDGKVICLMGSKPESRVFTVRNARLAFTGKTLSLKGNVLASGGVPGEFHAVVDLTGHLDLELSFRERTMNELVRLFALDFPWIERVARGSGQGDLVYAVTGAPGQRTTAGRLSLRNFTGFIGDHLEARRLSGEVRFISGQALLKDVKGQLGPVHISSGEGFFSLEEDRWKLHSRATLSSPDSFYKWKFSGRPEIVVTGTHRAGAAVGSVMMEVRFSGEDLLFEHLALHSLRGAITGDGKTVQAANIACRFFDTEAVLDLRGDLEQPFFWTLSAAHIQPSRLSVLVRDDSLASLLESVSGTIPLSLKGTVDYRGMSSGVDILIPEAVTFGNDQISLGPGSINVVCGKVELQNVAMRYNLFPLCTFTTNLFGTLVFDERRSGQWLLTSSPYEISYAPTKFAINGVMSGGGTFDSGGGQVEELIMTLPDEGKLFLRPFIVNSSRRPDLVADLESVSLGPLQALLPRGIGVSGKISGNLHLYDGARKLAGEIMVPKGEVQLPMGQEAWNQWAVAPLYVSVTTDILDAGRSRYTTEAEIRAEEAWGTFALQARLGEKEWWLGEGLLMLSPEKTKALGLNTLAPIFKTDKGGLRLPLRLEGGIEVPNMAVNVGQEIGRALVRHPGRLLQSITP